MGFKPFRLKRSPNLKTRELSPKAEFFSEPCGKVRSDGGAQSFCVAGSTTGKHLPRSLWLPPLAEKKLSKPPTPRRQDFTVFLARNLTVPFSYLFLSAFHLGLVSCWDFIFWVLDIQEFITLPTVLGKGPQCKCAGVIVSL